MLRRWRSLKLGAAVSINGGIIEYDSTCNFLGRVAKLALYVEYSPAVTLLNDKEDVVYYLVDLNYRLDVVPSNLASFCNKGISLNPCFTGASRIHCGTPSMLWSIL